MCDGYGDDRYAAFFEPEPIVRNPFEREGVFDVNVNVRCLSDDHIPW